jgi:predicted transcriptional regulator
MRIPQTQMDSWAMLQESLPEKRFIVLEAFKELNGNATIWEIANHLGWTINNVSGRVTELHQSGYLFDSGKKRVNPNTLKNGIVWKIPDQWSIKKQVQKNECCPTCGRKMVGKQVVSF